MRPTWMERANAVGEGSSAMATEIPREEGKPLPKKFRSDFEFEGITIKSKRILHCFISLYLSTDTRRSGTTITST